MGLVVTKHRSNYNMFICIGIAFLDLIVAHTFSFSASDRYPKAQVLPLRREGDLARMCPPKNESVKYNHFGYLETCWALEPNRSNNLSNSLHKKTYGTV